MLPDSWSDFIAAEKEKQYMKQLGAALRAQRQHAEIYPPKELVFNAFRLTPPNKTKVVILGQDPYHGPGQAMGLAFSVPVGQKIPPSLRNIFAELQTDLALPIPNSGDLTKWAEQGVLLLNSILTVRAHSPMSHSNEHDLGWEVFTREALKFLGDNAKNLVFIAWGGHAMKFINSSINKDEHLVLSSAHPSPLSAYRGFLGSRPFSKANDYLIKNGIEPVDWSLN